MTRGAAVDLDALAWPSDRLGEALEALAERAGLAPRSMAPLSLPEGLETPEALQRLVDCVVRQMDVEAEPVEIRYAHLADSLRRKAPVVLRLERDGGARFLCVLAAGRRSASVLAPDRSVRRVPAPRVHDSLRSTLEAIDLRESLERFLAGARVPRSQHARLRSVYLRHSVGHLVVVDGWSIRPAPGSGFIRQLRLARVPWLLAGFVATHTVHYAAWVLSWWLLGRAALSGHVDAGWFAAWILLLGTLIPLRLWSTKLQARLVVGIGALLKKRLLDGALRLEPEEVRTEGVGQLLGRAIESEGVEALALGGGFLSLVAVVELLVAGAVMVGAGGGPTQGWLLLAWVLVGLGLAWLLLERRRAWADVRQSLTHDLVDAMIGYRTRLAQEAPERWHGHEDQALARYVGDSRAMDRVQALLTTLVPRGWLVLGFLGALPAVGAAGPTGNVALAVAIGGALLAHRALASLTAGLASLVDAVIAWNHVRPLFQAASRRQSPGLPLFATLGTDGQPDDPAASAEPAVVLDANNVAYRYAGRAEPVVRGCSFSVRAGENVLLEGPSGSGKSTLASLLAGLRQPASGLLLLRGLDYSALGDHAWRKQVVLAPQFHENHVLAETFLFNLLMGRRWPPEPEDVKEAHDVCRELGLGPLVARMPSGLHQVVGDTGWRLSHGERSRLFVARALLQRAAVVIFDESFAALDPMTLRECLLCVLNRPSAAVVIAHP